MLTTDEATRHRKFVPLPIDPLELVARAKALLEEPVSAETMPAFVAAVNEVSVDFSELYASRMRANDEDTADEAAKQSYLDFLTNHVPELAGLGAALSRKQLEVADYVPPADLADHWADMRVDVELFREENLPLEAEVASLAQAHSEVSGSLRVELDGETLTLGQAGAKLESPDRGLRERAYRAMEAGREATRPRLDEIFAQMLPLRRRIALNAGLPDYRAYAWRKAKRREYTPEDVLAMHDSVAKEVVPRLRAVYERRARLLGLERLRPWDLDCDVHGRDPLAPFQTVDELVEGMARMYSALDPELAGAFDLLRDGWMDLEPRQTKVPGLGYANYFPRSKRPYIYWSAVGTDDDVLTMRHEGGHAFHALLTQNRWPYLAHMSERPEMCELASQAMELLTLPYLAREAGGFYSPEDAGRSQAALLVRALSLLVSASRVDAIQHFIYTHPSETGPTIAEIDAQWRRLGERFDLGMDMTGFDRQLSKGWHIIHVFHYPFYYIEYAMAYLGALQVWRNAMQDAPRALRQYKEALALGGTRPLDELYEVAGIRFAFDRSTVAGLSQLAFDALGDEA